MAEFAAAGGGSDGIADASFKIECSNGVLAVSASDAAKLIARCHFFQAAFAHGTTEVDSRVVWKPDWMLDTREYPR